MPSLSPQDLEARAERAVRRGELLIALDHYEALLAQQPDDERLRSKIESVRSLLQPSELVHRRKSDPAAEEAGAPRGPLNDAEEGELHAAAGRFEEAVASYRRAVSRQPRNELLRERLQELIKLAPPGSRALDDGLAGAERLEQAPATPSAPRLEPVRSARAADAVFRPLEIKSAPPAARPDGPGRAAPGAHSRPPAALPKDPVELLKLLLQRVTSAKRRS